MAKTAYSELHPADSVVPAHRYDIPGSKVQGITLSDDTTVSITLNTADIPDAMALLGTGGFKDNITSRTSGERTVITIKKLQPVDLINVSRALAAGKNVGKKDQIFPLLDSSAAQEIEATEKGRGIAAPAAQNAPAPTAPAPKDLLIQHYEVGQTVNGAISIDLMGGSNGYKVIITLPKDQIEAAKFHILEEAELAQIRTISIGGSREQIVVQNASPHEMIQIAQALSVPHTPPQDTVYPYTRHEAVRPVFTREQADKVIGDELARLNLTPSKARLLEIKTKQSDPVERKQQGIERDVSSIEVSFIFDRHSKVQSLKEEEIITKLNGKNEIAMQTRITFKDTTGAEAAFKSAGIEFKSEDNNVYVVSASADQVASALGDHILPDRLRNEIILRGKEAHPGQEKINIEINKQSQPAKGTPPAERGPIREHNFKPTVESLANLAGDMPRNLYTDRATPEEFEAAAELRRSRAQEASRRASMRKPSVDKAAVPADKVPPVTEPVAVNEAAAVKAPAVVSAPANIESAVSPKPIAPIETPIIPAVTAEKSPAPAAQENVAVNKEEPQADVNRAAARTSLANNLLSVINGNAALEQGGNQLSSAERNALRGQVVVSGVGAAVDGLTLAGVKSPALNGVGGLASIIGGGFGTFGSGHATIEDFKKGDYAQAASDGTNTLLGAGGTVSGISSLMGSGALAAKLAAPLAFIGTPIAVVSTLKQYDRMLKMQEEINGLYASADAQGMAMSIPGISAKWRDNGTPLEPHLDECAHAWVAKHYPYMGTDFSKHPELLEPLLERDSNVAAAIKERDIAAAAVGNWTNDSALSSWAEERHLTNKEYSEELARKLQAAQKRMDFAMGAKGLLGELRGEFPQNAEIPPEDRIRGFTARRKAFDEIEKVAIFYPDQMEQLEKLADIRKHITGDNKIDTMAPQLAASQSDSDIEAAKQDLRSRTTYAAKNVNAFADKIFAANEKVIEEYHRNRQMLQDMIKDNAALKDNLAHLDEGWKASGWADYEARKDQYKEQASALIAKGDFGAPELVKELSTTLMLHKRDMYRGSVGGQDGLYKEYLAVAADNGQGLRQYYANELIRRAALDEQTKVAAMTPQEKEDYFQRNAEFIEKTGLQNRTDLALTGLSRSQVDIDVKTREYAPDVYAQQIEAEKATLAAVNDTNNKMKARLEGMQKEYGQLPEIPLPKTDDKAENKSFAQNQKDIKAQEEQLQGLLEKSKHDLETAYAERMPFVAPSQPSESVSMETYNRLVQNCNKQIHERDAKIQGLETSIAVAENLLRRVEMQYANNEKANLDYKVAFAKNLEGNQKAASSLAAFEAMTGETLPEPRLLGKDGKELKGADGKPITVAQYQAALKTESAELAERISAMRDQVQSGNNPEQQNALAVAETQYRALVQEYAANESKVLEFKVHETQQLALDAQKKNIVLDKIDLPKLDRSERNHVFADGELGVDRLKLAQANALYSKARHATADSPSDPVLKNAEILAEARRNAAWNNYNQRYETVATGIAQQQAVKQLLGPTFDKMVQLAQKEGITDLLTAIKQSVVAYGLHKNLRDSSASPPMGAKASQAGNREV